MSKSKRKQTMLQHVQRPSGKPMFVVPDLEPANDGGVLVSAADRVALEAAKQKEVQDRDIQLRKTYNDALQGRVIDPKYGAYKMSRRFALVRYFLRNHMEMSSGLYIPQTQLVKRQNHSGLEYGSPEKTAFAFRPQALIVSIYEDENSTYKSGDIVYVRPPEVRQAGIGGESIPVYVSFFAHHEDYPYDIPTDDISSPHFGYALIDPSSIIAKIE